MTVTGEPTRPAACRQGDARRRPSRRRDALAVREVCPYPRRRRRQPGAAPTRPASTAAARCSRPRRSPSPSSASCASLAAHVACATYLAAHEPCADDAAPATPGDDGAALWPGTRSPPLVLEPARRMGALPTGARARAARSAALIGADGRRVPRARPRAASSRPARRSATTRSVAGRRRRCHGLARRHAPTPTPDRVGSPPSAGCLVGRRRDAAPRPATRRADSATG